MSKVFRPYAPDQSELLPASPRDWLPPEHVAYFILDTVAVLDLSALMAFPKSGSSTSGERNIGGRCSRIRRTAARYPPLSSMRMRTGRWNSQRRSPRRSSWVRRTPRNRSTSIFRPAARTRTSTARRCAKTFFVSSGVARHPTPEWKTNIRAKIATKRYTWNYGPGNPDNYDLAGVKWNLQIADHIFIHSAYWHNNFGYRMSHGCINMATADALWVYDWANVGTPVETANRQQTAVIALR